MYIPQFFNANLIKEVKEDCTQIYSVVLLMFRRAKCVIDTARKKKISSLSFITVKKPIYRVAQPDKKWLFGIIKQIRYKKKDIFISLK